MLLLLWRFILGFHSYLQKKHFTFSFSGLKSYISRLVMKFWKASSLVLTNLTCDWDSFFLVLRKYCCFGTWEIWSVFYESYNQTWVSIVRYHGLECTVSWTTFISAQQKLLLMSWWFSITVINYHLLNCW